MLFCKRSSALFAAALGLVMLSGTAVRADFIPWTYNWTRNPIAVGADAGGTGGIALTNEPVNHAVGASDIVATELRTFSSASASTPDTFTNAPFSLTLALTDDGSHQTGSLTFNGVFNGSFSSGSANITASWTGSTTQTVTLGSDSYTVTDLFVPEEYTVLREAAARPRQPGLLYAFSSSNIYAAGFAGVALGIARSALDAFVELARDKIPRGARSTLRDNNVVQSQVAQLRAAKADTFMIFAFGKFAVQAFLYAHKLGWRPQVFVNAVASSAEPCQRGSQ